MTGTGGTLIFLMMGLPIMFFMVVWSVGMAIRLTSAERNPIDEVDAFILRHELTLQGEAVRVGARDIRQDQLLRAPMRQVEYEYEGDPTYTLPHRWVEDLYQRVN